MSKKPITITKNEHDFLEENIIKANSNFYNKEFDSDKKTWGYKINNIFFFYLDKKEIKEDGEIVDCKDCYRASYYIGAQRVKILNKNGEKEIEIVIAPKIEDINYSEMFMTCLRSGIESREFSKIYYIDIESEEKYIEAPSVASVLDPLLLAHFLSLVDKIIKNGLKKNYVYLSDNLKKPKGKINVKLNDLKNIIPKRYDRVYCNYSVYSEDIPENRIIKRALLFAKKMFSLGNNSGSLEKMIKKALVAFESVSDQIQISEIKQVKCNKLYKEYPEAVRLAKMILKRYGYSISNVNEKENRKVPPFWIDMASLFEHYTLVKLKQKFGENIIYQYDKEVKFGWRPDFLLKKSEETSPMILDSKYKSDLDEKLEKDSEAEIIRQLSGYSREEHIRNQIGAGEEEIVPCVLIYPIKSSDEKCNVWDKQQFIKEELEEYRVDGLRDFYSVPIGIPMLDK